MKLRPLIDRLIRRWPIKVLCTVVALLLYFFFNISQLSTETFSIEVNLISNGQMMPVSSYQKHVRVTVRASNKDLASINRRDIIAQLNLNPYSEPGRYNVPIVLDFSPEIFLIEPFEVEVYPESIPIQLEDKTFEYKNIQVSFADEVPYGYELISYSVNPSSLKVIGSRSAVKQTTALYTNRLSLARHTSNFSAPVSISTINSLISIENDTEVIVSVKIAPIQKTANFEKIPVKISSLNPSLELISSEDIYVSFTISGSMLLVDELTKDSFFVYADCKSLIEEGEYEIPLNYVIPREITLKEKPISTIKLSVKKAEQQADNSLYNSEKNEETFEKTE